MKKNTRYFLKITYYISILFFYTSLESANGKTSEFVIYQPKQDMTWNGWQQKSVFTIKYPGEKEKHLFTLWKNTEEPSFSLMSNNHERFEWIINPSNAEERCSGPDIYRKNEFTKILQEANRATLQALQTKSGFGPMSVRMYLSLTEELNKIIRYKKWLGQNTNASNIQLVSRVFSWNRSTQKWELRKDAPNPLLAVEYYKLYKEFQSIEKN